MYTMCMMIEDKRLLDDREFDMVSKLREDKEGDDYDEDARMAEASVNYQNSLFNGQGYDDDKKVGDDPDEWEPRICGQMENVTFHIRETNEMSLYLGQDTKLFKRSLPGGEDIDDENPILGPDDTVPDDKVDAGTDKKDDTAPKVDTPAESDTPDEDAVESTPVDPPAGDQPQDPANEGDT